MPAATPPRNPPSFIPRESEPDLGPSDSTDSASDLPPGWAHTDSDAAGTGERSGVDSTPAERTNPDIRPDNIVDANEAGVADTPEDSAEDEPPS